ncbi:nuclear transport factor 2 family protein [Zoogloea sp.]|uniref:nuclear transport factor 2 family protein n=1 Tax=Zoogloea sp. TaxID=49181 RepID=UPI002637516E|nr:nuclear transport factor 2 family protein [Zoogloea sp.]MDD3352102.1 nuclear transport factor 2 family protein [Zoogloea sp.]
MSATPELIADRLAISDVIINYATALDTRDWGLLRSILTDRVAIDYTSFDPDLDLEMDASEWVHRVRGLAGFDATQHLSTNHRHVIDGDQATCISYMHASHFLTHAGADHVCVLYGYYTSQLLRTAAGWKLRKVKLTITARHGDARVFEWAFSKIP